MIKKYILNLSKTKKIFLLLTFILLIVISIFSINKINGYFEKFQKLKEGEIFSNNKNINKITFSDYEIYKYEKIDYLLARKNITLKFIEKKEINISEKNFHNYEWQLPLLNYHESNQKPTGFLDEWNDKLIIVSGNGQILLVNNIDLKKSIQDETDLKVKKIQSNLFSLVFDENFYGRTWISVKDILIDDDEIYIVYTKKFKSKETNEILIDNPEHQKVISIVDDNCYGISILKANLNTDFINFRTFIDFDECVYSSIPEFTAHLVGGRLINFGKNFLLSTGDFRTRFLTQDKNSILGKILLINRKDKSYEIFSTGHRNPQGLLYDEKNDLILSTEHGPWGGDEINIILNGKNYGWPISSYGKHYCEKKTPMSDKCKKKYLDYPLHKSHIDFGYEEPIKYFEKSLGISEIIKLSNKFSNNNFNYLVSSLGGEKGRQFYLFNLDFEKNYKILNQQSISSEERVRDIVSSDDDKYIYAIKEDTSKFSVIF